MSSLKTDGAVLGVRGLPSLFGAASVTGDIPQLNCLPRIEKRRLEVLIDLKGGVACWEVWIEKRRLEVLIDRDDVFGQTHLNDTHQFRQIQ